MGRKATLEPRWLVGLLNRWALRDAHNMSGGLGYPSKAAFTIERADGGAQTDPTGYNVDDLADIEGATHKLALERPELFVAVSMYYRPWTVVEFQKQGYPFGNSTYYWRLQEAHRILASGIPDKTVRDIALHV